jgi:hypothetical protein
MHKARLMCKVYYAVDVKRIMPPNGAGGVDNPPKYSIMRLSIRAEIFQTRPGPGGHDADLDTERCQMCQPVRTRHPEPPPRKSYRCIVSGVPFLRPARLAAGQIRDAATGHDRWTASWGNSNSLRVLAGVVVSTTQTFRGRGTGRIAASTQRSPAGSQTVRGRTDLRSGYIESRTRSGYRRMDGTSTCRRWGMCV